MKSHDDEFLMVSLAGIFGSNSIGHGLRLSKIDRAARRTAGRILDKIYKKKTSKTWLQLDESRFVQIVWGTPDFERLQRCFDRVGRAIYFHEFGLSFSGEVKTHLGYLKHEKQNGKSFQAFLAAKLEQELDGTPRRGENPDVFFYQFTEADQFGLKSCRMVFYGGLSVMLSFIPSGVVLPDSFTMKLIELGVSTTISVGERTFKFNGNEQVGANSEAVQQTDED